MLEKFEEEEGIQKMGRKCQEHIALDFGARPQKIVFARQPNRDPVPLRVELASGAWNSRTGLPTRDGGGRGKGAWLLLFSAAKEST